VETLVEVIKQSLYGPYQVNSLKFNVQKLINEDKILDFELEEEVIDILKFKKNY